MEKWQSEEPASAHLSLLRSLLSESGLELSKWSAALHPACTLTAHSDVFVGTPPLDRAAILRLLFEYCVPSLHGFAIKLDESMLGGVEDSFFFCIASHVISSLLVI
jgi:hypothetical protein